MKALKLVLACFSLFFIGHLYALQTQANPNSPVGFWKTIDDVSGKAKAIIQIEEMPNKILQGKIVKVFPDPGHNENEVCTACDGAKHNQRILGMTIIENLKQNKNNAAQWIDGTILDPRSGKYYHSSIRLIENGQRLNVRGYIGLPLFGRSQTWIRVSNPLR